MDEDISLEDLESPAAAASVAPTAPTARWLRLERSAKQRLSGLRVVLEDLCDPGNRAAILRSVEAFGLLHVHEICGDATLGRRKAQQSSARGRSIVNGAEKWLNLHQHQDVEECIRTLQAAGFGVWAAVPPSRGTEDAEQPLDRLPFEMPTALLFGSEARGVSAAALSMCDGRFTVPLSGLSESLNVSVCVAVCVHYGALQRRKMLQTGQTSDMHGQEVDQLLESYADRSLDHHFAANLRSQRSLHRAGVQHRWEEPRGDG